MPLLESTDAELLRKSAMSDPAAFAVLRDRHLNLVYAAAVRQSSDLHQAEDVTQAVFLLLSQRTKLLARRDGSVAGWLLLTTRNVARNARRAERRLKRREQKAAGMRQESVSTAFDVHELRGVIDQAMAELSTADRDAITERFFGTRSVTQVAKALNVSESAAGKRIAGALRRLRQMLINQGITTTEAALAVGLPTAVSGPAAPRRLSGAPSEPAARLARSMARRARLPALGSVAAVVGFAAIAIAIASHNSPPGAALPPNPAIPAIQPMRDRSVTLRLVDPATHGSVTNATVSLIDDTQIAAPEPASADGTYTFTLPQPLTFMRAVCRAPGRVPMEINFTEGIFRGDRPREYVIPMELGTRIGGVVTNEVGDPLEGATVRISNFLEGPMEGAQLALSDQVATDADGRWHFDLAPSNLRSVMIELRKGNGPWVRPDITLPPKSLRDGTLMQQLDEHRGKSIDGVVTDIAGHPVAGAVVVFAEDRYEQNKPSGRTDADGRFHVADVDGDTIATVQAIGFAPQQQQVEAHAPGPLQFKLLPASVLEGGVVDDDGEPVSGATVEIERWNNNRAIKWSMQTTRDGRFAWKNAPSDDLQLNVRRDGFASLDGVIVRAGSPARLVLHRPVQVTGKVIDADTQAPIRNFKMTYGIRWTGSDDVTWQTQDTQTLTDGHYSAAIGSFCNGGRIRVVADGYAPAMSRLIRGDEKIITIDFPLHRGRGPSGVVLSPAGNPVAGARVISVPTGTSLRLSPDSQEHIDEWPNVRLAETDDAGKFHQAAFDVATPHYTLLVETAQGCIVASDSVLASGGGTVRLQPWGTLHATFRRNSLPAAGAAISLTADLSLNNDNTIVIERRAIAGADGKFTVDNVPPGVMCQVYENVPLSARSTRMVSIGAVKADAGRSVTASLGGVGRPVIGTVALPAGVPADAEIAISCTSVGAVSALRSLFGGSAREVDFVTFPDHTFRAEDVLPGTYRLTVQVRSMFTPQHPLQQALAIGVADLAVPLNPPCPNEVPVDLGNIQARSLAK